MDGIFFNFLRRFKILISSIKICYLKRILISKVKILEVNNQMKYSIKLLNQITKIKITNSKDNRMKIKVKMLKEQTYFCKIFSIQDRINNDEKFRDFLIKIGVDNPVLWRLK
jgi:hypothetical protein